MNIINKLSDIVLSTFSALGLTQRVNSMLRSYWVLTIVVGISFSSFSNSFAQQASINGTISLPQSVVASGDTVIRVSMLNVDSDGFVLDSLGYSNVTIKDGRSQEEYSFDYEQPSFISNLVGVTIRCAINCDIADGDLDVGFFLQDNRSFAPRENFFPFENIASSLNFEFPVVARKTIRGTVTLPAAFSGNGNVGVSLGLLELDSTGVTGISRGTESIQISGSERENDFELTILEPEPNARFIFSIRCNTRCIDIDGRTSTSFFLQEDGTFDDIVNDVAAADLPSVVNFQFPALVFKSVTGTISLPEGRAADGLIALSVGLFESGGDPFREVFDQETFFIQNGESSITYSLSFREPNPVLPLTFRIWCHINCRDVDNNNSSSFFLQRDGSFNTVPGRLRIADLDEVIDFQFPTLPSGSAKRISPAIFLLLSNE